MHDIGDAIAPANHSELAAAIVAPYLDAEATWVVKHHGVFRAITTGIGWGWTRTRVNATGTARTSTRARTLCRMGSGVVRPDYDTLPIDNLVPLLREVFTRPASGFGSD